MGLSIERSRSGKINHKLLLVKWFFNCNSFFNCITDLLLDFLYLR